MVVWEVVLVAVRVKSEAVAVVVAVMLRSVGAEVLVVKLVSPE